MKVSRGVEQGVEDLAVDRYRCRASVEVQKHHTQEMRLDRSTGYRGGVEMAISKSLEARQIARCRGGVKLAFKISFSRREKRRYECNQACNSKHHINLSKSSLNNNFKHMDPKNTHTHTH